MYPFPKLDFYHYFSNQRGQTSAFVGVFHLYISQPCIKACLWDVQVAQLLSRLSHSFSLIHSKPRPANAKDDDSRIDVVGSTCTICSLFNGPGTRFSTLRFQGNYIIVIWLLCHAFSLHSAPVIFLKEKIIALVLSSGPVWAVAQNWTSHK